VLSERRVHSSKLDGKSDRFAPALSQMSVQPSVDRRLYNNDQPNGLSAHPGAGLRRLVQDDIQRGIVDRESVVVAGHRAPGREVTDEAGSPPLIGVSPRLSNSPRGRFDCCTPDLSNFGQTPPGQRAKFDCRFRSHIRDGCHHVHAPPLAGLRRQRLPVDVILSRMLQENEIDQGGSGPGGKGSPHLCVYLRSQ
jgi:hypothetical protein